MNFSEFTDKLEKIVNLDSGSSDTEGIRAVSSLVKSWYEELGFSVSIQKQTGCLEIKNYTNGKADFMFSGHLDTVFPHGTAAQRPFTMKDKIAYGPGVADMKGGIVLMYLFAKEVLRKYQNTKIFILLNSDEELGSAKSRNQITQQAANSRFCFVFEPGRPNGELIGERKGIIEYQISFHGIAAHAGTNPEKGASAIRMMAQWIVQLENLNDYAHGISVNVGLAHGGTAANVIPEYAGLTVEMRFQTNLEKNELQKQLLEIQDRLQDERIEVIIHSDPKNYCPPMETNPETSRLHSYFLQAGKELNLPVTFMKTGGSSDANNISAAGIAAVDGCGPCGTNLHSDKEYLLLDSVPDRMNLLMKVIDLIYQDG